MEWLDVASAHGFVIITAITILRLIRIERELASAKTKIEHLTDDNRRLKLKNNEIRIKAAGKIHHSHLWEEMQRYNGSGEDPENKPSLFD